ncbi:hypothetical protein D3C76_209150 [compost metagenome]
MPDGDNRRIAGVIVHIPETFLRLLRSGAFQNFEPVSGVPEDAFEQLEMDRRHLRRQNGIGLLHFLCKRHVCLCFIQKLGLNIPFFPLAHRREQRPQTDARRPQIADLINLDQGIYLVVALQNFLNGIAGNGINTAAEGGQLHQFQIVPAGGQAGRTVHPGMVGPLVDHAYIPFTAIQMADRILSQHGQPHTRNHLGDAVVNFGVSMVRMAAEQNAFGLAMGKELQRFFAFVPQIRFGPLGFGKTCLHGSGNLFLRDIREGLHQNPGQCRDIIEGEERAHERYAFFFQSIHVVADHFGIRSYYRAVEMVLRRVVFLLLVHNSRIKDEINAFAKQALHMAMGHLRRIADGFRRNGIHSALVELLAGFRGQHCPIAQCSEKGMPERIILEHVHGPWNSNRPPLRLLHRQPLIIKKTFIFVLHQIRQVILLFLAPRPALTAVAGDMEALVGEAADRQRAVVGA